ncbi:MAG: RNase P modulator RnpM [Candidatus Promineifilaceae bacterium]
MAKKKQPRRQKHVPQRTCVACRNKYDKRQITRIVRTTSDDDGMSRVVIDSTGKRNGRGAYLCDNPACWQNAIKRNMLNIALKTELTDAEKETILDVGSNLPTPTV